jgi:hypothetical protein
MIEVTVRDGRDGRDRTRDSADGGAILATLQRDQPYEIGDVITFADGDAVVVIGDNEQIQPGASWKQTVFVGELRKPQPRIAINLGGCSGWTLQRAGSTTTFVRCVDATEAKQIMTAAAFCRQYAILPTHRLLISSFRVWKQTFARTVNAKRDEWQPALAEDLMGAFVGWVLIWRLVLDQAAHDLSSRFGKDSDQCARFHSVRRGAHAASRAYRVVDALRDLVQHRGIPSLRLSRTKELDRATGQRVTRVSYKFCVSDLVDDPKCASIVRKEFRSTPDLELELPDLVDEAMAALNPVLLELVKISTPELITCVHLLRKIFTEASGMPLLLRVKPPLAGSQPVGVNFDLVPLHDLQFLIQNYPIPGETSNANADQ